jgi:hypothetical protein
MRQKRKAYRLLVGKLEGKRPVGRPKFQMGEYHQDGAWIDRMGGH